MNLIKRTGPEAPSQAVPERDEETGDLSGVQTGTTPEIDEDVELSTAVRVRKDLPQSGVGDTEFNHHLAVLM